MKFEEFVCFEAAIPELQAKDRDGAITELVAALVNAGKIPAESGRSHETPSATPIAELTKLDTGQGEASGSGLIRDIFAVTCGFCGTAACVARSPTIQDRVRDGRIRRFDRPAGDRFAFHQRQGFLH